MIIHSALPLFIQHHSPGETDSFVIECALDCGFEMLGTEGHEFACDEPAVLEFAARLLRKQRLLEKLVTVMAQDYDRVLYAQDGDKFWRLPYELVHCYDGITTKRIGSYQIATVDALYDAMGVVDPSREGGINYNRSTKLSSCVQWMLDDIVKFDPDFQDMRDADAARELNK